MRIESWKVGIAVTALVWLVVPVSATYAAGTPVPSDEEDPIFMTQPAPLSASQSAAYAEAQLEAARDPIAASATGEDEGMSGLEVVGIIFLLGLGAAAIAIAASDP